MNKKPKKFNDFDRICGHIGGFYVEGTYHSFDGGRLHTGDCVVYGVPRDAKLL